MIIQDILFIVFIGAVVLFVNFLNKKGGLKKEKKAEFLPYMKNLYLLTPAEHEFFNTIEKVVEGKYYVFPQVVLADIVKLKGKGYFKPSFRTKIDKKTLDFVLFDKQDISPILVIELDDYTHQIPNRKKRDIFLNKVLDICKIPILHTPIISEVELKIQIEEKITS